jgi:hypothetical protein
MKLHYYPETDSRYTDLGGTAFRRPERSSARDCSEFQYAHRQKERGNEAWVLRLLGDIAAHADPPTRRRPGNVITRPSPGPTNSGCVRSQPIVTSVWGSFTAAPAIRSTLKDTWRPP